jgi:hypothetical protein
MHRLVGVQQQEPQERTLLRGGNCQELALAPNLEGAEDAELEMRHAAEANSVQAPTPGLGCAPLVRR